MQPRRGLPAAVVFCVAILASTAMQGQAPTVTAFDLPSGVQAPWQIAPGPDGNLWFTVQGPSVYIGRVTPAGFITLFPVPTPLSYPTGITTGADGNIWFTEAVGNKIGRISPFLPHDVVEFPLPTPNRQPAGIVSGPDGSLWFCESSFNSSNIGRISTSGVITEFVIPTPQGEPQAIAVAPDGNLWFNYTSPTARRVGRITPAGTITEIPFPLDVALQIFALQGIARGPDGNLWSIGQAFDGHDQLVRITPAGSFSMFPIPTQFCEASVISAGPDGGLWFVENNGGKLARATTSGDVTEFEFPTALGEAAGITAGADGNVWFTEIYPINKVARVNLAPLVLAALSPAKIWVGLKNSDDSGLRVDLRGEIFVNSTRVGEGQFDDAKLRSGGFNNATLSSIALNLSGSEITLNKNDLLKFRISGRRTCSGGGRGSGTVRLWYNGQAVDSGPARASGTRFDATISGSTSDYFARDGFTLSTTNGSSGLFIDEFLHSSAPCPNRPFIEFGTWSISLP